jgi:hypothetical protein
VKDSLYYELEWVFDTRHNNEISVPK